MAMATNSSAVAIKAAIDGKLRLLKKMASRMDLREAKDPNVGSLLHLAAARGHVEICRLLVEESGLDVNCTNPDGETPVAVAATGGEVGVLRYLLDHGSDPAMPDAAGGTPLHIAAENGHEEAVRLLLSRGVDVDPLNNRCVTPLNIASGKGHDQALKVLLEHSADPNRGAHNIFSPLMMACTSGSLKCIKLLVEAGADVNFKSPCGASPLLKAVVDGSTDIVKFLLEAGANPNTPDMFGEIPIMHAAHEGRRDLVKVIFPHTKPISSLPNWNVDGIITTIKHMPSNAKRFRDGELALLDAQKCKMMRPRKAWYRDGAALSLLKNYKGAANAFVEALNLDPANDEIKTALRQ
ncbi:hypothetical protein SETIT_3G378600v2 [Setaria italica]|uniref:PGG domain-containing protein n=1 Tax=Setaria italica TaxID=4555 RepID=A0A368QN91_SETIT|nr:hypothetical protein SETIT_3G378600v2 [Setaria italica]